MQAIRVPGVVEPVQWARFRRRLNRFVVEVCLDQDESPAPGGDDVESPASHRSRVVTASMGNPGKLGEILLPGARLGLTPGPVDGKHSWRVVMVLIPRGPLAGACVLLDTGKTNEVAAELLERRLIPALEGFSVRRREAPIPGTRSRVDFVVERRTDVPPLGPGDRDIRYLEVKSCTLFNGRFAMFPDAKTERGRRHLEELAETGIGAVLMVVHTCGCDHFSPDFHTDLSFARTMDSVADQVPIVPVGIEWAPDGSIVRVRTDIGITWDAIRPHLRDRGSYLVLLHLSRPTALPVGALGTVEFSAGHYLYVGSAQNGLSARLNRHRRSGRKKPHWHIDYLREAAEWMGEYPIREPAHREEAIVEAFEGIADGAIPGFGATDSTRESHLLYFRDDPRTDSRFQDELLRQRRITLEASLTPHRAADSR